MLFLLHVASKRWILDIYNAVITLLTDVIEVDQMIYKANVAKSYIRPVAPNQHQANWQNK